LENRVKELNLGEIVSFAGWVNQQETLDYYRKADIFCFPSVREFGGAVVIEAMACGLPCIVANNGGIGEYVTEETGFKIEPNSREYLTQELTKKIKTLVEDDRLRESMSAKCIERAKEFEWDNKAIKIVEIYEKMLAEKARVLTKNK
jgi:glycosyltransferase involved in cell wall biosynthesis